MKFTWTEIEKAACRMRKHLALTGPDYSASPYKVPGGMDNDLEHADMHTLAMAYLSAGARAMEFTCGGTPIAYVGRVSDDLHFGVVLMYFDEQGRDEYGVLDWMKKGDSNCATAHGDYIQDRDEAFKKFQQRASAVTGSIIGPPWA